MKASENARVLVVEDEPMVGEMIQAMLEHAGLRVVSRAETGRQAIEMTADLRPDVVLMDIGLPDMDGIEAAQQIGEHSPVPVVILSAYDTPALLERAAQAGVGAYLVKPADVREMERAIAVALARWGDMVALRALNKELEAEVAERKRAERALEISRRSLQSLFDTIDDFLFLLDTEGRIIHTNPVVHQRLGYPPEALEGQSIAAVHPPEEGEQALAILADAAAGRPAHGRLHLVAQEGERIPIETHVTAGSWFGQDALYSVCRDITEQVRAEQDLKASEERFRTAVEYSHDWEDWLAADGSYIYVSPACQRITGYAREEFLANPHLLVDITVLEDRGLVLPTAGDGEMLPHEYQFRIISRNGETRWIERVCQPVHREDGAFLGWRTSNRDVTDRKRLEERLREARKMEAVGQLAGGLAHDLNNLLTVINGYADFALEETVDNEALRDDLEEIRKAGERAGEVIAQLLAYSRQQLLRLTAVDLNDLIQAMYEEFSGILGENVELRLELAPDANAVRIDAHRLRQGLEEMAANASAAMGPGDTFTLETRNVFLTEADVAEHRDVSAGDFVLLRVSDTGSGMDADTRSRVFEPFFTTRDRAESDGLGLSAVYGMVRQVGGLIEVQSEPQRGTTFEIFLPKA
ncbi:MAG: PAS domain S-box protein [Chloroflexi bacterium]|nr:PAS domain S-box protein [Chloroflexota bacterium]